MKPGMGVENRVGGRATMGSDSPAGLAATDRSAERDRLIKLASAAWRERGFALIRVGDLADGAERSVVETVARRLYGERHDADRVGGRR